MRMKNPRGGIPSVLEILELLDPAAREKLLMNIAEKDGELARALELGLFTFEDIQHLSERHTQELLKEVPEPKLILSLRKASDALKAHIYKNLSQRRAASIQSDLAAQAPQKLNDVLAAQAEIIEIARRLESEGKLLLQKQPPEG